MKKILALFSLINCLQITAQTTQNGGAKPYVEVSGTSETEISPDEIYISITLSERAENKEKLNIEKQEESLKSELKNLGVDLSNLTLNTADADFRKIKTIKKDLIISKSYTLKISNADLIGKVYEKLDIINVADAYISKFNHSKILEFAKENRVKAVKAAKDKAEYLLAAVGQQLGGALEIREVKNEIENTPNYYFRNSMSNVAQSYGGSERFLDDAPENISFKKIKIKSTFLVKYEIK
jgi:uncharacterized protein